MPAAALRPGAEVSSLEGSRLQVGRAPAATSVGGIKVGGAQLVRADIEAANGVIHGAAAMLLAAPDTSLRD